MQFYRCDTCGKLILVLEPGNTETICCNKPMKPVYAKIREAEGGERHVPVYTKRLDKYLITIGNGTHPQNEGHYIKWIAVRFDNGLSLKFFRPGDEVGGCIRLCEKSKPIAIYAMCNIHGLWKTDVFNDPY